MRSLGKLLFFGALALSSQFSFVESSAAQSAGPDPRSAFSESISFPGGYVYLQYDPKVKALNVRQVNNDGSGIHSFIGIGWSYFTTSAVTAGGKESSNSTNTLTTCLASNIALIKAQFAAISAQIMATRGSALSPNFSRSLEWVQTACQSVLPLSSAKQPDFNRVPPQLGSSGTQPQFNPAPPQSGSPGRQPHFGVVPPQISG
jgi:hypothetical protein